MGIASNKRYQLIKGLRRSLRNTPPFTGTIVRELEESDVSPWREEQDAPEISKITAALQLTLEAKEPTAAVVQNVAGGESGPAPRQAANDSATPPSPELSPPESPVQELSGTVVSNASEGPSASSSSEPAPVNAAPVVVAATGSSGTQRASGWSFTAGLLLGIAASSAVWSWANLQAATPEPALPAAQTSKPEKATLSPSAEKETKPPVSKPPAADKPKPKPVEPPATPVVPAVSKPPAPAPAVKPAPVAVPKPPAPVVIAPPPAPKPAEKPAAPPQPKPEPKPETPVSVARAMPAAEFDKWKAAQIAAIEAEFPELHPWFNTVVDGSWRNSSRIVGGNHPSVKSRSRAHLCLLKWLNLQPPRDPDTRRAVHNMLVRVASVSECLDLWEPLVKNGASNIPDIQAAADALRIMREENLKEDQNRRLQAIIDHSPAAPAPASR